MNTLQFVGVDNLLDVATQLGVRSLANPGQHCPEYPADYVPEYGLSLTLGGGEAKLVEMVGAYGVFANGGLYMEPSPILRIEDSSGEVLRDNSVPPGERAISAEHAYLVTDILSDTEARCQAFRCPSWLELSRPAAAKTGTTDDYRDAWTIGYTPDLVAGVWVGNSDNSMMDELPGAAGAAPIWHKFMEAAHEGVPVGDFERPRDIVEMEVCADCGTLPTSHCTRRKTEIFAEEQPPEDEGRCWYRMVAIDALSGLRANDTCPGNTYQSLMVAIDDELEGWLWAQSHLDLFGGLQLAPFYYCDETPTGYGVYISQPERGGTASGTVQIIGTVMIPNFHH